MEPDTESATLEDLYTRLAAKLSPEDWVQLQALLVDFAKMLEQSETEQKSLLRRLGVHSNLEDREERWLRLWAAAHYAGFSGKELWGLTWRELSAVLELKATELELLNAQRAGILRPEGGGDTTPKAVEIASPQPQRATISNTKDQGRKRGPKPDYEGAARVAEIVARVAPGGEWRGNLDGVCEALDEAAIPFPAKWRRDRQCRCWADCLEKPIAIKAIEYRLEIAKQRKKTTPETFS